MGRYHTLYGGKRRYEIHGDTVFPRGEECFNECSLENALRAFKRISVEKGVFRKEYERMSNMKKKKD